MKRSQLIMLLYKSLNLEHSVYYPEAGTCCVDKYISSIL